LGVSYLIISHDLALMRLVADEILVLYAGRVAELGPAEQIFEAPAHPYTKALLSVGLSSKIDEGKRLIRSAAKGEISDPVRPPTGCRFNPRCPLVMNVCSETEPMLTEIAAGHSAACWAYGNRDGAPFTRSHSQR
jgi:peptide/nickel transport system ATP-binding protein